METLEKPLLLGEGLGSGPIKVCGVLPWRGECPRAFQEEEGWTVCSGSARNSLRRSSPYFPKSRGVSRADDRKVLSGIIHVLRSGLRSHGCPSRLWALQDPHQPLPPLVGKGIFQLILSELARSAVTEAEADTAPEAGVEAKAGVEPEEVLMIDATYVKAHRTASSLKKGAPTRA